MLHFLYEDLIRCRFGAYLQITTLGPFRLRSLPWKLGNGATPGYAMGFDLSTTATMQKFITSLGRALSLKLIRGRATGEISSHGRQARIETTPDFVAMA